MDNSTHKPIFVNSHIRKHKDTSLKIRLQTLIKAKGLSEKDFYKSLGYSPQVWYALSWGIWEANIETMVKVAQALCVDSSVIWQSKLKEEPSPVKDQGKAFTDKKEGEVNG